jgi:hypothetical protein
MSGHRSILLKGWSLHHSRGEAGSEFWRTIRERGGKRPQRSERPKQHAGISESQRVFTAGHAALQAVEIASGGEETTLRFGDPEGGAATRD